MADHVKCINWLLKLEDSRLLGTVTKDSDGLTRYGLLDRWHPDLVSQGFYICGKDIALSIAQSYYKLNYWDKVKGDLITFDSVAAELLSFAVNDGIEEATKLAQRASGQIVDGRFGPVTLLALNKMDPTVLVTNLKQEQIAYYYDVVKVQPSKASDLKGWINRVNTPFIES